MRGSLAPESGSCSGSVPKRIGSPARPRLAFNAKGDLFAVQQNGAIDEVTAAGLAGRRRRPPT